MSRPLQKTTIDLRNGIQVVADPEFRRPKGRHWIAGRDGQTVGEFWTWQESRYRRQEVEGWGRGGGDNYTVMVRSSWVSAALFPGLFALGHEESPEALNTERYFEDWKKMLGSLPHSHLRRIRPAQPAHASGAS